MTAQKTSQIQTTTLIQARVLTVAFRINTDILLEPCLRYERLIPAYSIRCFRNPITMTFHEKTEQPQVGDKFYIVDMGDEKGRPILAPTGRMVQTRSKLKSFTLALCAVVLALAAGLSVLVAVLALVNCKCHKFPIADAHQLVLALPTLSLLTMVLEAGTTAKDAGHPLIARRPVIPSQFMESAFAKNGEVTIETTEIVSPVPASISAVPKPQFPAAGAAMGTPFQVQSSHTWAVDSHNKTSGGMGETGTGTGTGLSASAPIMTTGASQINPQAYVWKQSHHYMKLWSDS